MFGVLQGCFHLALACIFIKMHTALLLPAANNSLHPVCQWNIYILIHWIFMSPLHWSLLTSALPLFYAYIIASMQKTPSLGYMCSIMKRSMWTCAAPSACFLHLSPSASSSKVTFDGGAQKSSSSVLHLWGQNCLLMLYRNLISTGRNLDQDSAHMDGPSLRWRRGCKSGEKNIKRRGKFILNPKSISYTKGAGVLLWLCPSIPKHLQSSEQISHMKIKVFPLLIT